jgi:hypothetical protein
LSEGLKTSFKAHLIVAFQLRPAVRTAGYNGITITETINTFLKVSSDVLARIINAGSVTY